jgi:hypothetical protein
MTSSCCCIAVSMSELDELEVMCCISLFWWASKVDSCGGVMVGCAGRESSIVDLDFDAATEDGSVSGSKSAFRILASFAESVVLGVEIAILI